MPASSAAPTELRSAALQSVLQWHFAREAAGNKRQVTIAFALAGTPEPEPRPPVPPTRRASPPAPRSAPSRASASSEPPIRSATSSWPASRSASATGRRRGDPRASIRHVRQFDEHLSCERRPEPGRRTRHRDRRSHAESRAPRRGLHRRLDLALRDRRPAHQGRRQLQSSKLIRQPRPAYPEEAKAARIQGVVKLSAVIAKDGTIKSLEVISGHPLLVASALDAVRQWVYETTLLNGNPVEVQTQIDVNYTLSQ